MLRKPIFAAAICAIVLSSSSAFAWDGSRKGFQLGGGLGIAAVMWEQEVEIWGLSFKSDTESDFALATDFKIGYAPTDQLAIYYFEKTGWFTMTNILDDDVIVASGVSGVGASYYFAPEAPSFLLSGGLGFASWSLPFEDNGWEDTWYGFGLTAGVGYEFIPHLHAGLDFVWAQAQDNESGIDVTTNAYAFLLTINATGY